MTGPVLRTSRLLVVLSLLATAGCPDAATGDDGGPRIGPDAATESDANDPSDGGNAGGETGADASSDASAPDASPEDASPEDASEADTGECAPPPAPDCVGVCALTPPSCTANGWMCSGPGFEPDEVSCDGYDNDCDGETDENVCATCLVPETAVQANLFSIWDIDFDYACRTYLTSLVSGPDFTRVVSATVTDPALTYFGNANQNMGFALVDPDPTQSRVVVTYSCCPACSCMAQNGLTLLYTCSGVDPGCGCAGQVNCPGFLDAPFIATGALDTSVEYNGFAISTPNGLAIGPGGRFYVGNFMPLTCSSTTTCDACDPTSPGIFCSPSRPNCCDSSPLGRLVEFTLPAPGVEPTWRVVQIIDGEEIVGLASGRDGSIYVGTFAGPNNGNIYRYDPVADVLLLLRNFGGTVFSITEERRSGELYLEVDASPKLNRLSVAGSTLALPIGVPPDPLEQGVLQYGPDHRLYRLRGDGNTNATLEVYEL